eukprot:5627266-Prymnesium_polylepis.1
MAARSSLDDALERLRVASRRYEDVLSFAAGLVATFYGRQLTYSILFCKCFAASGWQHIRPALVGMIENARRARVAVDAELPGLKEAQGAAAQAVRRLPAVRDAYLRAQAGGDDAAADRLSLELATLEQEMGAVTRASSSVGAILRALEPQRMLELARAVYRGLVASLASATALGAAKLGIGYDIGNAVVETMRGWTAPLLQCPLEELCQAGLGASYDDPQVRAWTDYAIGAACSSVGVGVALQFERVVFTASNAIVGAELLMAPVLRRLAARGLLPPSAERSQPAMLVKYSICAAGVYAQFFGRFRALASPLHLVLLGPLLMERWLVRLASIARSGSGLMPPPESRRPEAADDGIL